MTTYIDLSIARIHQYLERTRELKLVRGASTLIATTTSDGYVNEHLRTSSPRGCTRLCATAGATDSMIHLELHCTCGECTADEIAREWLRHLRGEIPAAELRAKWGDADSYTAFARSDDSSAIDSPAPANEISVLTMCESCRRGYSQRGKMCIDCRARLNSSSRRSATSSENRLLDALGLPPAARAESFEKLAELGPTTPVGERGSLRKNNHLATVYIDGNSFRTMFSKAARIPREQNFKVDELSLGISEAAWTALVDAAKAVHRLHSARGGRSTDLPLIPHLVAADDLCVSLPAAYGWAFAHTYCTRFTEEARGAIERAAREWTRPADKPIDHTIFDEVSVPSASAAIVTAHVREPFHRTMHLAETLLKDAKKAVKGKYASALWLDVTRDGTERPSHRAAVLLGEGFPYEAVTFLSGTNASLVRNLMDDALAPSTRDATNRLLARLRNRGLLGRGAIGDQLAEAAYEPRRFHDLLTMSEWWTPWM